MKLPIGMSQKIYLAITLVITIPMLFFAYFDAERLERLLLKEKEEKLLEIATTLDQKISSSFVDILASEKATHLSKEEQVKVLNRHLQPIVRELAKTYPDYGMGVYCPELQSRLAMGPIFTLASLKEPISPNILEVYRTGKYQTIMIEKSATWGGKPALAVAYPIYRNGKIIGHAWGNSKIEDLRGEFYLALTKRILAILLIWLVSMAITWWVFSQLSKALAALAEQIQNEDDNLANFQNFPQLLPVIDRIITLRESLKGKANALQLLIDNSPIGIIAVDDKGKITNINEAYLQYLPALQGQDWLGESFKVITDAVNFSYEKTPLIQALRGQACNSTIVEVLDKKFAITAYPIKDLGNQKILGAVAMLQDITVQEKLSQELQRMDRLGLIGQMAASLAHEIRNPMTAIRGFVQLLMLKSKGQHDRTFGVILEELDRTNQIVTDFLTLARNRKVEKEESSLNELIMDIYPLVEAEAVKRDLKIKLELSQFLPKLQLNRKEIKQLLLNLICNGLDAMDKEGCLTVATKYQEGKIKLSISDTGCGIAEEKLAKLFEPFYTTKEQGTGLGLAVCWSITKRHDAQIQVQSQAGVGTTFTVNFNEPALVKGKAEKDVEDIPKLAG